MVVELGDRVTNLIPVLVVVVLVGEVVAVLEVDLVEVVVVVFGGIGEGGGCGEIPVIGTGGG